MFDDDLRMRARRFVSGDRRQDDVSRLYQDLRFRSSGQKAFREIADFLAHRQERNKGEIYDAGRFALASFSAFMSHQMKEIPVLEDAILAAQSNLRSLADRDILRHLGVSRNFAKARLQTAIECLRRGQAVPEDHKSTWDYLRTCWTKRPAFSSECLAKEFAFVLVDNNIIEARDAELSSASKDFITLHALTVMHGSKIKYGQNQKAQLYACFDNMMRHLTVMADLRHEVMGIPVGCPTIVFQTIMDANDHCTKDLISYAERNYLRWDIPLDLTSDERLGLYDHS